MINKDKLTSGGFACLIAFPILAMFSGIGTHNTIKISGVDSYISVFLAYIIGFLPLLLFILIFNYRKELNINEKITYLFGKFFGCIINNLINILVLIVGMTLFHGITNFAISQFLADTPILVLMIIIGIILVYNVSLGFQNITRVATIFLGFICFLTIISTSGALSHFDISNIKPILENGLMPPFKGGLVMMLTNVVPIFTLLIIPKSRIRDGDIVNKYLFVFYTLAFIFAFVAMLLTIGALGIYLCDIYQYPEYTVLKKISLFNFIDRIENFIYIKWIFSSFICLSLIIYYLTNNIKKDSKIVLPSMLIGIMIYLALNIFKNNTVFYSFILNIYPYICLLLLGIFMIIGINIIVRKVIEADN